MKVTKTQAQANRARIVETVAQFCLEAWQPVAAHKRIESAMATCASDVSK